MRRDPVFIATGCVFVIVAAAFIALIFTVWTTVEPSCGHGGIDDIGCGGGRHWTREATVAAVLSGLFVVLAAAALTYGLRRRDR